MSDLGCIDTPPETQDEHIALLAAKFRRDKEIERQIGVRSQFVDFIESAGVMPPGGRIEFTVRPELPTKVKEKELQLLSLSFPGTPLPGSSQTAASTSSPYRDAARAQ